MKQPFGENLPLAERYQALLAREGIEWGLIGPREGERLWERHLLNCLPVAELIPLGAKVLDIGSGAGLPGIPLALERPDLEITLLEPLARRVAFLELAISALELGDRVSIVRGKAASLKGQWPIVTARAVAPLPRLVEWAWPLIAPGGALLALKGESGGEELEEARPALERVSGLSYALHRLEQYVPGVVLEIRKAAA